MRIWFGSALIAILALSGRGVPGFSQNAPSSGHREPGPALSPQQLFVAGEAALQRGDLDHAEANFKKVLEIDPKSAGAYANLGVIHMRRKEWEPALRMLKKAERLAPKVAGIRLNIGLAYYRQNEYPSAIPPFESVLRDQPDSTQARYLLGLCYFFVRRWAEAADTLEPLWVQQSLNITYLYVLGIAAHKAGKKELDERALGRMIEVGKDTPEFHLLMGKAHLNNQEEDKAIAEFDLAGKGDPNLPFLHFHIGLAYLRKQDYQRALEEFQKDAALEPDVAYNYDRMGEAYAGLQQNEAAEKSYRHALQIDARIASSQLGLAQALEKQGKHHEALATLDRLLKLDPESYRAHYLRGQVLRQLGQSEKAKEEFATYTRLMNAARDKRGRELSGEIPNPDLMAAPE